MDTILLSIEYYGNLVKRDLFLWHNYDIVYRDWVNAVFLYIDFSEKKKDIQKEKRVVLKKEREYYRAAMTGHSAGTFALPRVDIAGLRIFKLRFVVFP